MSSTTPLPRRRLGRTRAATALAAAGALIMSAGVIGLIASPASADHNANHNPPGQINNPGGNATSSPGPEPKVVVCKYVTTPGGVSHHIVIVSENTLRNTPYVAPPNGDSWTDAHGQTTTGSKAVRYAADGEQAHFLDFNSVCGTPPTTTTDVCPNLAGNQASVPAGLIVDNQGNCVPPPTTTTDVCPNIQGDQASVPEGYQLVNGDCVQIAGEETLVPKPKPDKKPTKAAEEPTVKGVQVVAPPAAAPVAAPTAVAAGFGGTATTSPLQTIAQMLVAGGMLLLMAGAWIGLGRRETGTHEA